MNIEKPSNEKNSLDAELESTIRRMVALAEDAVKRGDFVAAASAFKEAAVASFELGDVEGAMRLLDSHEDASRQQVAAGPRIAKYLNALQLRVNQAMKADKHGQARDLLKQMLAIAEQGRDPPAIKAIKEQLGFVTRMQGKR